MPCTKQSLVDHIESSPDTSEADKDNLIYVSESLIIGGGYAGSSDGEVTTILNAAKPQADSSHPFLSQISQDLPSCLNNCRRHYIRAHS